MILDDIAEVALKRVEIAKLKISLSQMRELAFTMPKGELCFEKNLRRSELSFICEVKKASPSKGIISHSFPYIDIAREYEQAGADCVSCLTEPKWFLGSDTIFREIRSAVSVPMLRKDFTVDEYQIYEAKYMGANAVLLICSLLDTKTIAQYLGICQELGLSALVEAHDEKEIESAVSAGANMIGVNNRNLKNFSVDFSNVLRLRDKIPASTIFVAESGVKSVKDVALLKSAAVDAVLIGEAFMKTKDKQKLLEEFREAGV